MRPILQFAPAAAFYIFALAAQVSGFTSSAVAGFLAMAATVLLFLPACHHSHVWHKARKSDGKQGLDSWYFIAPCLALAMLAIAGAAYGFGLRSISSQEITSGKGDQPTAPVVMAVKPQPEFLKNISFSRDSKLPLGISATVASTTDRLRILIEVSGVFVHSSYSEPQSVQIQELKDLEPVLN
jgi:hypothetical protein